ncbi:MAG: DUF72 domain-containing protein [Candidatus Brocadiae bacterium]|nr:DUF72 domain-containing protein [Candidatus Brocadiia bacterium]
MSALRFGTAGWSFADWSGLFYPKSAAETPLAYYARYFNCAEVNVTFYRPPGAKIAAGWVKQVAGRDFVFAVKASQEFTHTGAAGAAEARGFLEGIAPLAEAGRLGPILLQFPWSFRNTPGTRDRVARLAEGFAGRETAVEFRHASWDTAEARDQVRSLGLAWVNIDQPALRDCLAPSEHVTAETAYLRLHGRAADKWFAKEIEPHERYDYYYSAAELDPWVDRIRRMMAAAKAVYVIGNNHYRGKAPANTLQLKARIQGGRVAVPEPLIGAFPELAEIAEKPAGRLF